MRSCHSAHAKGLDAYLLHSWDPAHRPATIELDPRHRWTGLTIIATSGGGPDDTAGTVEFVAALEIDRGAGPCPGELRENSLFGRHEGRWVYETEVDG